MPATKSKATLFRLCSFPILFLGFLTAVIGEAVLLSDHAEAARTVFYIAFSAITVGCIACLEARAPPSWPFGASSAASSSATATPICYYISIITLCLAYLALTAALLLRTYDPQRQSKPWLVLLLFSPVAYLAGCVFAGVGALTQCRELGRSVQDIER